MSWWLLTGQRIAFNVDRSLMDCRHNVMSPTTAESQRAYRIRVAQKLARATAMEQALRDVLVKLEGRAGPLGIEMRAICEEALK